MRKIAFFIGEMQRGGAERVISILANHYSDKGWEVAIVLLLGNRIGYTLNSDISIIDLSEEGSSYIKRLPRWIKSVRRYLKETKPDKVVSFIGRQA